MRAGFDWPIRGLSGTSGKGPARVWRLRKGAGVNARRGGGNRAGSAGAGSTTVLVTQAVQAWSGLTDAKAEGWETAWREAEGREMRTSSSSKGRGWFISNNVYRQIDQVAIEEDAPRVQTSPTFEVERIIYSPIGSGGGRIKARRPSGDGETTIAIVQFAPHFESAQRKPTKGEWFTPEYHNGPPSMHVTDAWKEQVFATDRTEFKAGDLQWFRFTLLDSEYYPSRVVEMRVTIQ